MVCLLTVCRTIAFVYFLISCIFFLQGLIEPAIEYATESGAFDHALELAQACCPAKLPGIHLKHALFLEDEERFKEVS